MMKTRKEILRDYFFIELLKEEKPLTYNNILEVMRIYGEQEYKQGIEDGKIIAKHGTVNCIEDCFESFIRSQHLSREWGIYYEEYQMNIK